MEFSVILFTFFQLRVPNLELAEKVFQFTGKNHGHSTPQAKISQHHYHTTSLDKLEVWFKQIESVSFEFYSFKPLLEYFGSVYDQLTSAKTIWNRVTHGPFNAIRAFPIPTLRDYVKTCMS